MSLALERGSVSAGSCQEAAIALIKNGGQRHGLFHRPRRTYTEAKLGERNFERPGCQLRRAEPPGSERELEQVDALPTNRHLDDAM